MAPADDPEKPAAIEKAGRGAGAPGRGGGRQGRALHGRRGLRVAEDGVRRELADVAEERLAQPAGLRLAEAGVVERAKRCHARPAAMPNPDSSACMPCPPRACAAPKSRLTRRPSAGSASSPSSCRKRRSASSTIARSLRCARAARTRSPAARSIVTGNAISSASPRKPGRSTAAAIGGTSAHGARIRVSGMARLSRAARAWRAMTRSSRRRACASWQRAAPARRAGARAAARGRAPRARWSR
jgi:hypothetical protein